MENRFLKRILGFGVFAVLVVLALSGCRKEQFNDSPDYRLQFSSDSVIFDTVFNTVGSATQILMVYNRDENPVRISNLRLVNDPNDSYRINVDGLSGELFSDVEIGGKDSIYIFIEVTVTPDQDQLYPFVDGALEFTTNGTTQDVKLVAWGWDAIFYYPTVFPTNGLPNYALVSEDLNATVTWTSEKPIVVYGYVVVDSTQTLVVNEGTQVFFHQGSGLWIYEDGRLLVNGTVENPVVFQGDRLEAFYDEEPGQWDRIWINNGGDDHVIRNAIIKNNFIGIQVEPLPFGANALSLSNSTLVLENVAIRNNSIAGIFSRNYKIDAENLLLSRAGQYLLAGTGAGMYNFDQCTFGNNWNMGIRQTPGVFLSNLYAIDENTVGVGAIDSSRFRNCIFWGNALNEIGMEFDTENAPGDIDLKFQTCLFRVEEEVFNDFDPIFFEDSIWVNLNPGFVDFSAGNFNLTVDSEVRGKAKPDYPNLPQFDLVGRPYDPNFRPLGCLEYFEE